MGRRKAYAQVVTPRLYEDLPNLNQQAVMSAVLGRRSIPNSILMASLQGPKRSIQQMIGYAKSGNYAYGMPTVTSTVNLPINADEGWMTYLPSLHPDEEEIETTTETNSLDPTPDPTPWETSEEEIVTETKEEHSYIVVINDFGQSGLNHWVDYNTLKHTVMTVTETTTVTTTTYEEPPATPPNPPTVTSTSNTTITVIEEDTTEGPFSETYAETTGTIPALASGTSVPLGEEVLPIIPIRINKVDYESDGSGLVQHEDIKRMLGKIKMDAQDMIDGIKENPDEGDIDDAFIGFATGITETEEWALAGLSETFALFHSYTPTSEADFIADGSRQSIVIEEADFNNTLSFNFIRVEMLNGSPGYTSNYTDGVPSYTTVPNPYYDPLDPESEDTVRTLTGSSNEWVFTKPVPQSTTQYIEVTVQGLTSTHSVEVPGFGFKTVEFKGNEEELVVPLIKPVISAVPNRLVNDLIYGSARMFIYAYQIIKLKWYQSGIFKAILGVIAIALAVFTYGATLVTAFGAGTLAGIITIAEIIAIGMLVDYAVQWLVEEVGGPLALILGVLLSTVTGNFSTMTFTMNTSWYSLFTSAVRVYGSYVTAQINEINDQQAAFDKEYEGRLESIEAATELLDWGTSVDLISVIDYRSLPNTSISEEPQQFYNRTSRILDMPTISNGMITNYYDAQLELPSVDSYLPTHSFNGGNTNARI